MHTSRTICVGDVHGAGLELQAVLEKAHFRVGTDRLILVGDLFDRGRHGHLVWSIIKRYNATCILGNHEQKFYKYLCGRRTGGLPPHYYWALNNLLQHGVTIEEFYNFIENLPMLVVPQPGVIATHGGVNVTDPYREEEGANVYGHLVADQAMPQPTPVDGETYWWDVYKGEPLVVYGHLVTHDGKPRRRYAANGKLNSIGLDTAAVHGGPITAFCLETQEVFQYQSGVAYHSQLKEEFKKHFPEPSQTILKFVAAKQKEQPYETHFKSNASGFGSRR